MTSSKQELALLVYVCLCVCMYAFVCVHSTLWIHSLVLGGLVSALGLNFAQISLNMKACLITSKFGHDVIDTPSTHIHTHKTSLVSISSPMMILCLIYPHHHAFPPVAGKSSAIFVKALQSHHILAVECACLRKLKISVCFLLKQALLFVILRIHHF